MTLPDTAARARPRIRSRWGSRCVLVRLCVVGIAWVSVVASEGAWAEPQQDGATPEVVDEAAVPSPRASGPEPLLDPPEGSFSRLLPEWDHAPEAEWSVARRASGRGAKIGWDFLNDTVSDSWYTASSPARWRWREWLIVGGAAGVTAGLVLLADEPLRDAARKSDRFEQYGENVRWVGQGGALLGLTGGFLLSGLLLDRDKDLDTVRLLLESSLIGHGYGVAFKYTAGRSRPRTGADARSFDAFSGSVSMPSGEALNVFLLAGVVTAQYPSWPVQILSYGIAGAVAAGRIGVDAHWGSDIFVSAVIGIAVSKTIVKLNRVRARDRLAKKRLEVAGSATPGLRRIKSRHLFGASARSVRWTWIF